MKIITYRVVTVQKYRHLEVETDLGRLVIPNEQKLLDEFGLLFCGPAAESFLPPVEIPSDRSLGRDGYTAYGCTDDAEIIGLFRKFRNQEA